MAFSNIMKMSTHARATKVFVWDVRFIMTFLFVNEEFFLNTHKGLCPILPNAC